MATVPILASDPGDPTVLFLGIAVVPAMVGLACVSLFRRGRFKACIALAVVGILLTAPQLWFYRTEFWQWSMPTRGFIAAQLSLWTILGLLLWAVSICTVSLILSVVRLRRRKWDRKTGPENGPENGTG